MIIKYIFIMKKTINMAIFASGSGTNMQIICNYFEKNPKILIKSVFSNNKNAFVLERAKNLKIDSFIINRYDFYNSTKVLDLIKSQDIDIIVLAGFLWLVPEYLIDEFPKRIINIHPALLPKYGGKGMYGEHVHRAVFENNETETGITIHFVNKNYDEGDIIFQKSVPISENDNPETIAQKVHELEYEFFPKIIELAIYLPDL